MTENNENLASSTDKKGCFETPYSTNSVVDEKLYRKYMPHHETVNELINPGLLEFFARIHEKNEFFSEKRIKFVRKVFCADRDFPNQSAAENEKKEELSEIGEKQADDDEKFDFYDPLFSQRKFSAMVRALPVDERENICSVRDLASKVTGITGFQGKIVPKILDEIEKGKPRYKKTIPYCPGCWVTWDACFCNKMKYIPKQISIEGWFEVEILIWMHHKEFYRSSNTAKELLRTRRGTTMVIGGAKKMEADVMKMLEYENEHYPNQVQTVVLFPSKTSITLDQVFEMQRQKTQNAPEAQTEKKQDFSDCGVKKVRMVVIDGTWRQCRGLQKRVLHGLPRVKLQPELVQNVVPIFNGLRKQSQKGRISTIEAVIMAMEELKGLGGKVSSQEISILRSNLKTMISEVRSLINLKPIEYAPEEDDDDDDVDDEEN